MKANSRLQTFLRELRLPRDERAARREERRSEDAMRSMRDSDQTADRHAAALAAERRRHQHVSSGNTGPM